MKRLTKNILLFSPMFFMNSACVAEDVNSEVSPAVTSVVSHSLDRPNISVQGNAVKEMSPDIVSWRLSIRSEGKETDVLAATHAKRLSALLNYLKEQGIQKDKIQTQHMQLSENWNYEHGKRFRQGYFASSSISFESIIKDYTVLWKGLAAQEGVSVTGSHFDISNKLPIQREARILALQAARTKAIEMAEALDMTVGKPLIIEDQSYTDDVRQSHAEGLSMMTRSVSAAPIVSPGKLDVRMRVRVVFALE